MPPIIRSPVILACVALIGCILYLSKRVGVVRLCNVMQYFYDAMRSRAIFLFFRLSVGGTFWTFFYLAPLPACLPALAAADRRTILFLFKTNLNVSCPCSASLYPPPPSLRFWFLAGATDCHLMTSPVTSRSPAALLQRLGCLELLRLPSWLPQPGPFDWSAGPPESAARVSVV